MDPVTLIVGSLSSYAVTELIKAAIRWTQDAVKCKPDCEKLRKELVAIEPDVKNIEPRLVVLRDVANRTTGKAHREILLKDLEMVGNWLLQLNNAILAAKDDVHHCSSSWFSVRQSKLSVRLREHFDTITRLGEKRQQLFLQLGARIPAWAQPEVQQQHQHQHHNWVNSPGEVELRKLAEEAEEAMRRAEITREEEARLSMSSASSSSGHGGWRSGTDSSGHGGWRSGTDSSGHGGWRSSTDSPQAHLLRQGMQASNVTVSHHDEQKHAYLSRRHTLAGVTQIAKAHGHGVYPPNDSWKY